MKVRRLGYERAIQKAKAIYSRIGRIRCESLNGEYIRFTNVGFTHLMRKGRSQRPLVEQERRFALIPYIRRIVQNPHAVIEYRKEVRYTFVSKKGRRTKTTSTAEFWTFVEEIKGCTVKVVIRQLGSSGAKHFFSVMGDNVQLMD